VENVRFLGNLPKAKRKVKGRGEKGGVKQAHDKRKEGRKKRLRSSTFVRQRTHYCKKNSGEVIKGGGRGETEFGGSPRNVFCKLEGKPGEIWKGSKEQFQNRASTQSLHPGSACPKGRGVKDMT